MKSQIEDIEHTIYLKWFDELAGSIRVDGIIYVKTDPWICHERVKSRNRQGEVCAKTRTVVELFLRLPFRTRNFVYEDSRSEKRRRFRWSTS